METLRQTFSVLLVFALLATALWALRRWGKHNWNIAGPRPQARGKTLHALERLTLSPQHSLHLVQVEGNRFVVATHPQGCTLLARWEETEWQAGAKA